MVAQAPVAEPSALHLAVWLEQGRKAKGDKAYVTRNSPPLLDHPETPLRRTLRPQKPGPKPERRRR